MVHCDYWLDRPKVYLPKHTCNTYIYEEDTQYVSVSVLFNSEQDFLHEEINSLQMVKEKLKSRICELEEEVRKTRLSLESERSSRSTPADDEVWITRLA